MQNFSYQAVWFWFDVDDVDDVDDDDNDDVDDVVDDDDVGADDDVGVDAGGGCSPPLSPSGLSERHWLFLQFLCGFEPLFLLLTTKIKQFLHWSFEMVTEIDFSTQMEF